MTEPYSVTSHLLHKLSGRRTGILPESRLQLLCNMHEEKLHVCGAPKRVFVWGGGTPTACQRASDPSHELRKNAEHLPNSQLNGHRGGCLSQQRSPITSPDPPPPPNILMDSLYVGRGGANLTCLGGSTTSASFAFSQKRKRH